MRLAIPSWQGRVSPVFDTAGRLMVSNVTHGSVSGTRHADLEDHEPRVLARRLLTLDVKVLICGAISHSLRMTLESRGIEIIPNVCGTVEDVLRAYLDGKLNSPAFLMPGCPGSCPAREASSGKTSRRHTRFPPSSRP